MKRNDLERVQGAPAPAATGEVEDLEVKLLLEGIVRQYGYDFRDYDPENLKRRVLRRVRQERAGTVSGLQERVLRDRSCLDRLIEEITFRGASLFDPPAFYRALRNDVIPLLRTYPSLRVWKLGCVPAEELYSLAVLLEDEGLTRRATVYATDMTDELVVKGRSASLPASKREDYSRHFAEAGGKGDLGACLKQDGGRLVLAPLLKANIVFASHYFVTDEPFHEFHLIVSRNLVGTFNGALRKRVYDLLHRSLATFGFLALGEKEDLAGSPHASCYRRVEKHRGIYRKIMK